MVCYYPLKGYRSRSGKGIVFNRANGFVDMPMAVPCGQCIGCRLERSRMWAVRCVHEASLHADNCFITLTFDDSHLSHTGTLITSDFQKFMKRLRKEFSGRRIRYFHCGEYGEKLGRPHHHACLFGFDFSDKVLWSVRSNVKLYRSPTLDRIWGQGYCTIGDVNFESAAYVARYVTKKITGEVAVDHYKVGVDVSTGEVISKKPEFVTMSRRPVS